MADTVTYSKAQLIAATAAHVDMPKAQVAKVVNTFFAYVEGSLQEGARASIPGFGTFYVHDKPATKARTITMFGEERRVPAKKASKLPKFRAAKALKDSL